MTALANTFFSQLARNAMLGDGANLGLLPLLSAGKVSILSGAQPANADAALSGNTGLSLPVLAAPAGSVAAGVFTASAIGNVTVIASGIANFARVYKSDGTTALFDTNVGNQTVTLSGAVTAGNTTVNCSALAQPLYAGQVLWFTDAVSGLKISITVAGTAPAVNAAAGATSFTCLAAGSNIANTSTSGQGVLIAAPYLIVGATQSVSAMTITAPAAGN